MKISRAFLLILILCVLSAGYTGAQSVRNRIFSKADQLKREAEARKAMLLSPNYYSEAMEYFKEAEEGMNESEEFNEIKELLNKAENLFRKSIEYSFKAEERFSNALKARNDCLAVGADTLSVSLWEDAESSFRDAMDEFEDDEIPDAEEYSFEAEKNYRQAELDAIKKIVCGPTWELLKKADDSNVDIYAPVTLKSALQTIYNAEKDLEENRYNNKYAQSLADDAYSEVLHAMNITEYLKLIEENDNTKEDIIIFYEEPLKAIAEKLGIKPKFEDGYTTLLAQISTKLQEVEDNKVKYNSLTKELKNIKAQIDKLKEDYSELEFQLNSIKDKEEKINEVKNFFKTNEAEVFTLNDKVIIRLKKLFFSSGSSVISPKYFGLLTKVIKTVEKFPESNVIVTAHTDGSGKAGKNLMISQRRADAVYQYLLANSNIGRKRLSAVGYGEKQPIASNETVEGRLKNRRIEIIIDTMKR